MSKKLIDPYKNESDSQQIGGITVENRLDRVSIYGSIDLTKDKEGLAAAQQLKIILDLALAELDKTELPDKITLEKTETVANPFV